MNGKCTHETSIVLADYPGFSLLWCTWTCKEYLIELHVGEKGQVATYTAAELVELRADWIEFQNKYAECTAGDSAEEEEGITAQAPGEGECYEHDIRWFSGGENCPVCKTEKELSANSAENIRLRQLLKSLLPMTDGEIDEALQFMKENT